MAPVNAKTTWLNPMRKTLVSLMSLALVVSVASDPLQAQSGGGQTQSQQPANAQPAQDIPDAPSAVQPPPAPKPALPTSVPPPPGRANEPIPFPGAAPQADQQKSDQPQSDQDKPAPPPMPPVETVPAGSTPRNQVSPQDDLYKLVVKVNFVQIPVMVKDSDGRRVDGLLPKDFIVKENGKPQNLTYFTSDPFELSVAVVLDIGMADVALQKVNQTYSALVGAFSPYDEVALYTYSSTVSQVTDFTGRAEKLTAALNEMKLVRGHNNGPPVLGGPLGPGGPTVNGIPVGGPAVQPVNTPPREAHVLNDAILRAALDLSKRERTRRKVIFVISDGRELGSKASYRDVLRLLETRDIQVRAVVLDSGALPGFRQVGKLHLPGQGYSNILPKYVFATCGEQDLDRLSRNAIEDAYGQITNEARNQYTLGYSPKPTTGSSAYRNVEVVVLKKGLKVAAKDGYFPIPTAR
jgi:VWFA-related protein